MAGGMSKRGSWGTLRDRINPPAPPEPLPPVRHCWVTTSDGRVPGLLLAWRKGTDGWEGRVVHPARGEGGWLVLEDWTPAALLDPVDNASE